MLVPCTRDAGRGLERSLDVHIRNDDQERDQRSDGNDRVHLMSRAQTNNAVVQQETARIATTTRMMFMCFLP